MRTCNFLIAALFVTALLASCNSDEYDQVIVETRDLHNRLRELKENLDTVRTEERALGSLIADFEQSQRKKSEMLKEFDDFASYEKDLQASLKVVDSHLTPWKTATRLSLVGEQLGLVRLNDGRTLLETKILALSEETVRLEYQGGSEEFKLSDLPSDLRRSLVHEPTIILESKVIK